MGEAETTGKIPGQLQSTFPDSIIAVTRKRGNTNLSAFSVADKLLLFKQVPFGFLWQLRIVGVRKINYMPLSKQAKKIFLHSDIR